MYVQKGSLDHNDTDYVNGYPIQVTRSETVDFIPENHTAWRQPPVKFVYDAVAERTQQLLLESTTPSGRQKVNGVH